MKFRKEGEGRDWPTYLPGGRIRTSTFALFAVFCFTWWLHATFQPPAVVPVEPASQVVPPGFVPDPEYTWVPRTNVETRPRNTFSTTLPTTTTTTTTETTPTETTSPSDTTSRTSTSEPLPTTVVDPDGAGPLPPTTITGSATTSPPAPPSPTSPTLPVPNRSGTSTTTTVLPGSLPATSAPPPPG